MLKGEVFGRQLFENQIFALFINTFLNGNNGICGDYLNGMEVTYSGSNVTVDTGAVCIQGRFLEEDAGTTLDAGTSNLFCKLVIEIDLDKVNTDDSFNQGYYKIVTDSSGYPDLTQTDIVGTNSGVYQYELARFKTTTSGITDFVDVRTYLDIPTIYDDIRQMVQDAIDSIEEGSAFITKTEASYSINEVSTGQTWIDGKPIYRKVVTKTTNSQETTINISEIPFDYLKMDGRLILNPGTSNEYKVEPFYKNNSDYARAPFINIRTKDIALNSSNPSNVTRTWIVILEYTKTTD